MKGLPRELDYILLLLQYYIYYYHNSITTKVTFLFVHDYIYMPILITTIIIS